MDISLVDGTIVIKKANKIRGRYRIEDLVAKMPKDQEPCEVDWGDPEGQEVW